MATRPVPENYKPEFGSLYCSDPNCEYCNDLRKLLQPQLKKGSVPAVHDDSTLKS
ncbi:MAG TPA: hypothetical protein VGV15_06455 [Terriglobales bacterium]|nr:hypothetical protein [Terriglobales bacterium]